MKGGPADTPRDLKTLSGAMNGAAGRHRAAAPAWSLGLVLSCASAALVGGFGLTANAQDSTLSAEETYNERLSILQQVRPEYDPSGMRLGSFVVLPTAEFQQAYDSNVFATRDNARSDFVSILTPGVSAQSDWTRHAIGFRAQGEFKRFARNGTENVDNAAISMNGRYDIGRDVYLLGGGGYQLLHEDRGSPDNQSGLFPTEYHVTSGNAAFVYAPGRLGFRFDTTVDAYDYNNVSAGGGLVIDNNGRDRVVYTAAPRVTYEIVPQYNAFVKAVVNARQYSHHRLPDGLNRNSDGFEFDVGSEIALAERLTGDAYIGYLRQDYADRQLNAVSGVNAGANLLWTLSPLTSARLNVARTVEETSLVGTPAYLQTVARVTVEHELLHNVLLSGSFTYINADFDRIRRSDNLYDVNVGARYLVNRFFWTGLEYEYRHRASDDFVSNYSRHIVALRLHAQL